jgi:hypothetical protein
MLENEIGLNYVEKVRNYGKDGYPWNGEKK